MAFTDDDLKRLKEWIDRVPARALTMPKADLIKALIARLEAAERLFGFPCDCDLHEAWRKSAGR